ncbi:hypothetical protein CIB48_g799 [Xylaria polymorpha]|nr:hypothetical protein CIB48_g799 [Xylaria polymorpha]
MNAFVTEILNKENEAYRQRLSSLQPETGHTDILAVSSLALECFSIIQQVLSIPNNSSIATINDNNSSSDVNVKREDVIKQCWRDEEDAVAFEPKQEAEIDLVEQVSGLTVGEVSLAHDSDYETEMDYVDQIPGLRGEAKRLEFQPERQAGDLGRVPKSRMVVKMQLISTWATLCGHQA